MQRRGGRSCGPSRPAPRPGADRRAERPRDQRQAGVDGAEALAELQVEAEGQHQPDHPGEEHERGREARRERALAEQAHGHQRRDPLALAAALERDEGGERERAGGDRDEGPGGPARFAAFDQRVDEQAHGERDEHGAAEVERRRSLGPGLRQELERAGEGDQAERHVDEEDRAPAEAEQVAVGQRTAEDGAEHGAEADHGPEEPEGLVDLVRRERLAQDPEALRDHDRGEDALQQAEADQRLRASSPAPQSALVAVKPATPIRNSRRRPKMSPSRPPVTRPIAKVSA